jgi:prefoldin subunit 5
MKQAIAGRLEELLNQQCDRFRSYLDVLTKQQACIESNNGESVLAHVELEESIAAEILAIQQSIEPLEAQYHELLLPSNDVSALLVTVEDLHSQARAQSERNRELLSERMADLRSAINILKNNPLASRRSLYHSVDTATVIDIQG